MIARQTLLLTAAAALAALFYLTRRVDEGTIHKAEVADHPPRYTLEQASLVRYDRDGAPALRATAEELDYFDDESATGRQMTVEVLAGTRTPWRASAATGRMLAGSRTIELQDQVVAQGQWPDSGEALTVTTRQLWIDPDNHDLHTDQPVALDSPARTGTAVGFRANWTLRDLHLLDQVNLHYDLPR